jgi:hypothetical protein
MRFVGEGVHHQTRQYADSNTTEHPAQPVLPEAVPGCGLCFEVFSHCCGPEFKVSSKYSENQHL